MAGVRLPLDLEEQLDRLALQTHRTKSYYIKRAIEKFLEEEGDYLLALSISERIKNKQERTYTLDEIKKQHDLLDA